ncbi:hypothetical protein NKH85_32060 [Mesorhizobium sp. M0924]|uniref:hypothetical protein n=1 Tax=unclassified Mesorhizobium TaxID=325217 RepID=UPI00333B1983
MSEAELHVLGAAESATRQRAANCASAYGRVPDEAVVHVIRTLFARFLEQGSARGVYAGAYVYGKNRRETVLDETGARRKRVRKLPMEDWQVLIKDTTRAISTGRPSRPTESPWRPTPSPVSTPRRRNRPVAQPERAAPCCRALPAAAVAGEGCTPQC